MSARLKELLLELAKHYGKTTRWRWLCKKNNATTDFHKIQIAEKVLTEASTGTVGEVLAYNLRLKGVQPRPAPPYKPTGF